ncbi:MAG: DNA repair exonuclease [Clostridia bacterium]|nr:DNA repair exonuclease [Clostridia bacterium]
MKILHTGDLHLDSPFSSEDISGVEKRREAQRKTLTRIMSLAKEEGCDLMLIAGDLFDSEYVSPTTEKLIKKLFAEAEFPIVISPGNHDPYIDGSFYKRTVFSDNVYIFSSPELQVFELDSLGVSVYGYAFLSASLKDSPLMDTPIPSDSSKYRLLCAHADLSSPISRYAPLTIGDIHRFEFDYSALGHIHNPTDELTNGAQNIRYCGFAEGRSFDERGDGHVLIIDLDEKGCSVTKKKVSCSTYTVESADVSDISTREELVALIHSITSRYEDTDETHVRLYLTGFASDELVDSITSLESECSLNNIYLSIVDETLPALSGTSLKEDISLRGEFYRALLPKLLSDEPSERRRAILALRLGLLAIDGKDLTRRSDE